VVADRYRIEKLLGKGGMAEVYAAVNLRTDKRVALKWIRPALASTAEGLARFRREALAAGRITHSSVVTVYDVVEHQGAACLVMELLEGETLAKRLARSGPLPLVEVIALILPVMRGVAAAHAEGVVHRDLKPDNIFVCLDDHGQVQGCKVLDFGVSKVAVPAAVVPANITVSGHMVGTPTYMSPEQVRGASDVDQRADVYAIGLVLYEMLAGRPPFVHEQFSAVILDILYQDAPPITNARPDVPRGIARALHRALARDRDRRFSDVPSFIRALEEAARDELRLPVGTPPVGLITQITPTRPELPSDVRRRLRLHRLRALPVVAALIALAAGTFAAWRFGVRRAEGPVSTPVAAPLAAPAPVPAPVPVPAPRPAIEPPPAGAAVADDKASPRARPSHRGGGRKEHAELRLPPPASPPPRPVAPPPSGSPLPSRAGKLSLDDF
jgi:serine/threonine-protein kinase